MLNKREKRKIKELAERARSTIEIRDTMHQTQLDSMVEIEEMLSLFDKTLKGTSDVTALVVPSFNMELRDQLDQLLNDIISGKSDRDKEFRNSANGPGSCDNDPIGKESNQELDSADIPDWAKKLKKEIAKKCHPDAIGRMNLSALEAFRRNEYFTEVDEAFREHQWDRVLLIGVLLDLYPEALPAQAQKVRITRCFQEVNSQVVQIRKSISYKWSEHWDDYELKWTILQFYLQQKGMPVPDKVEAIKIIRGYEDSLG